MLNQSYSQNLLAFAIILSGACTSSNDDQPNYECCPDDKDNIIGVWNNPMFTSNSSNCFVGECLEMNFELNADSSYQIEYTVYEPSTAMVLREFNDQGTFSFDCSEAGYLSGRYSSYRYLEGRITLNSDSLSVVEWRLGWNWREGLIILPADLGFTHGAYVILH